MSALFEKFVKDISFAIYKFRMFTACPLPEDRETKVVIAALLALAKEGYTDEETARLERAH